MERQPYAYGSKASRTMMIISTGISDMESGGRSHRANDSVHIDEAKSEGRVAFET